MKTCETTTVTPAETEHERSLRGTDPRAAVEKYRARMALYEDTEGLAEHAVHYQTSFIEPEGK